MPEIELDPELLSDFIVESKELLEEFSSNLIDLENNPDDDKTIGAIFRAAHTLKGSSAFFNLIHIKNFAHKVENLLDDIRNKKRAINPRIIEILLSGHTHLEAMFGRLGAGDYSTEFTAEENTFLDNLTSFLEEGAAGADMSPADRLVHIQTVLMKYNKDGLSREEVIREIEATLADLPREGEGGTSTDESPPGSALMEYRYHGVDLSEPVGQAMAVLTQGRETGVLDSAAYDQALTLLNELVETNGLKDLQEQLQSALDDFRAVRDSGIDFDDLLVGLMQDKLNAVVDLLEASEVTPASKDEDESQTEKPGEEQPASPQAPKEGRTTRKTMRIDEAKVDGFMNYVGELIVTSETFNYIQKVIENEKVHPATVRAFKNANQAFRELSGELQESLMEIRRVPIKGLLQKLTLMVRELSFKMNKKVKVDVDGGTVQVDKSIAENLEGPIVHVVRNSMDHGLETPEDRIAAGKSPEGSLRVLATADKEFFYLDIIDDGRGIDPNMMRKTAASKGLMSEAQAAALTDKEAVNLIFGAGFSTAREITDVSGRGVGMDVVRTNISRLNGVLGVDSTPGRGTSISLKIPLSVTLQVVKALLVRVGPENYIISLDDIVESLRPDPKDLNTVEGRGEVIMRRGQIFPLIRLYEVFNIVPDHTDPSDAILVVVDTGQGRYGLLVDDVLGQQQIVVKELNAQFKHLTFIAGSATLGDGRLGLVLDTHGLVRLSHEKADRPGRKP